jgi:hypothetical protein
MFRKGGNVGVGIMSGITDRVQAASGYPNPEEEYLKRFDPKGFAEREKILADEISASPIKVIKDVIKDADGKGLSIEALNSVRGALLTIDRAKGSFSGKQGYYLKQTQIVTGKLRGTTLTMVRN